MSLSIDPKNGVRLKTIRKHGWGFAAAIIVLESVFSFFLYISLAEKVFVVVPAGASITVPDLISYQGLLTSTSGSPLGGTTGAVYCFRYSIWDSPTSIATATDQLWPSGGAAPSNSTTTVVSGVFSDQLGRTDDLSVLNFEPTSSYYLQVAVNSATSTCAGTWETLTPRQQVVSDAWSQTSQAVYGNLLRTEPTSTGVSYPTVQIGTAGGGASAGNQTLLSLDQVNVTSSESIGGSCSINGTLWYDTSLSRALVCEGLQIWPLPNTSTTIAGIGTNASSAIAAGNVVFSNSNNVTFGQNGSTITISVPTSSIAATMSYYANLPAFTNTSAVNISGSTIWVAPFVLPQAISASYLRFPITMSNASGTANWGSSSSATSFSVGRGETDAFVIYTQGTGNSSLSLRYLTSGSATWAMQESVSQTNNTTYTMSYYLSYPITGAAGNYSTQTTLTASTYSISSAALSLFTGLRFLDIPFAASLSAGNYWIGLGKSTSTGGNGPVNTLSSASLGFSFLGIQQLALSFGLPGVATGANSSMIIQPGVGYFTGGAFAYSTNSIPIPNISQNAANFMPYFEIIRST
jgi:hypothetical protein